MLQSAHNHRVQPSSSPLSAMRPLLPKPHSAPLNFPSKSIELPKTRGRQFRNEGPHAQGRKIDSKKCENCVKDKKKVERHPASTLTVQCVFIAHGDGRCRECFNRNNVCMKRSATEAQLERLDAGKRRRTEARESSSAVVVAEGQDETDGGRALTVRGDDPGKISLSIHRQANMRVAEVASPQFSTAEGSGQLSNNQGEAALEKLMEAVRKKPRDHLLGKKLTDLFINQGRLDQAIVFWKELTLKHQLYSSPAAQLDECFKTIGNSYRVSETEFWGRAKLPHAVLTLVEAACLLETLTGSRYTIRNLAISDKHFEECVIRLSSETDMGWTDVTALREARSVLLRSGAFRPRKNNSEEHWLILEVSGMLEAKDRLISSITLLFSHLDDFFFRHESLPSQRTAKTCLSRALALFKRRNRPGCPLSIYISIIKEYCKVPSLVSLINHHIQSILQSIQNRKSAAQVWLQLYNDIPTDPRLARELDAALTELRGTRGALRYWQLNYERKPTESNIFYYSRALIAESELRGAEEVLKEACTKFPDSHLLAKSMTDSIIAQSRSSTHNNLDVIEMSGSGVKDEERNQKLKKFWEGQVDRFPSSWTPKEELAKAYQRLEDFEQIIALCEHDFQADGDSALQNLLAEAYRRVGDIARAVRFWSNQIVNGESESGVRELVKLVDTRLNINDAIDFWKQRSAANLTSSAICIHLGKLFLRNGNLDEAIKLYRKTCERRGNIFTFKELFKALELRGVHHAAIEMWKGLAVSVPQSRRIDKMVDKAVKGMANPQLIRRFWITAVFAHPTVKTFVRGLARVLKESTDEQGAGEVWADLVARYPQNVLIAEESRRYARRLLRRNKAKS